MVKVVARVIMGAIIAIAGVFEGVDMISGGKLTNALESKDENKEENEDECSE